MSGSASAGYRLGWTSVTGRGVVDIGVTDEKRATFELVATTAPSGRFFYRDRVGGSVYYPGPIRFRSTGITSVKFDTVLHQVKVSGYGIRS